MFIDKDCFACKEKGHTRRKCKEWKASQGKRSTQPVHQTAEEDLTGSSSGMGGEGESVGYFEMYSLKLTRTSPVFVELCMNGCDLKMELL